MNKKKNFYLQNIWSQHLGVTIVFLLCVLIIIGENPVLKLILQLIILFLGARFFAKKGKALHQKNVIKYFSYINLGVLVFQPLTAYFLSFFALELFHSLPKQTSFTESSLKYRNFLLIVLILSAISTIRIIYMTAELITANYLFLLFPDHYLPSAF